MESTQLNATLQPQLVCEIKALYEEAFPPEERIGWDDLMMLTKLMPISITAYHSNNLFIGFTIFNERDDFNWFWYFAVKKELRGHGYGQKILSQMIALHNDKPMIIDAESPFQESNNSEQRQRRYNFYLRNGFIDSQVGRTFEGITYTILLNGNADFTIDDYNRILDDLRSHWMSMPQPEK